MRSQQLQLEDINSIIEEQLVLWPEAAENFYNLRKAQRKIIEIEDVTFGVQYNPARIKSTSAAVDKDSINSRLCFLCKQNRPSQQISFPFIEDWELLINPYPILPVHFTITRNSHSDQGPIPLDLAIMAERAPNLAFFYNGAKAGASAPDHQHAQAVLADELPLLKIAENNHLIHEGNIKFSENFITVLPFQFISIIIPPNDDGFKTLSKIPGSFGIDSKLHVKDQSLLNAFFWIDSIGFLRIIIIPRQAHRPSCFFAQEQKRIMISPGAIDMAGLMISPLKRDFEKINKGIMQNIYSEVAFQKDLPSEIKYYFEK